MKDSRSQFRSQWPSAGVRFSQFLALLFFLVHSTSARVDGGASVEGRLHPIQQLVQWELNANPTLGLERQRLLVETIFRRAVVGELPPHLRASVEAYRAADTPAARTALIEGLDASTVRQLLVQPVQVEYFEIPRAQLNAMLDVDHTLRGTAAEIADSMVSFRRGGQDFVRWFIHPSIQDEAALSISRLYQQQFGAELRPVTGEFRAHLTSSRSIIVFSGSYENAMSVKTSLPGAHGPWSDKQVHLPEFRAWTRMNTYMERVTPGGEFPHMNLLQEPRGFGVGVEEGLDDGMLFRSLDDLNSGRRYYLPAFAVFDEEVGTSIARMNGSSDPRAFWRQHLIDPLAQGMAELRAYSGAEHTSPHSQNLLVELDDRMRPTGRIVMRDFDFYLDRPVADSLEDVVGSRVGLVNFMGHDKGTQSHRLGLVHGLWEEGVKPLRAALPSWLTPAQYAEWYEEYFQRFTARYTEITGIDVRNINARLGNGMGMPSEHIRDKPQSVVMHIEPFESAENRAAFEAQREAWISVRRQAVLTGDPVLEMINELSRRAPQVFRDGMAFDDVRFLASSLAGIDDAGVRERALQQLVARDAPAVDQLLANMRHTLGSGGASCGP